jgi:hypothetical protein
MAVNKIIFTILVLVLFSCTKGSTEKNNAQEAEVVNNDKEIVIVNGKEFIDIFINTIGYGIRYYNTILDIETPMYETDDKTSLIRNLPVGTQIVFLAKNNSRVDDRFYLIKTEDDSKLWSGWIQSNFINNDLNTEIDNIPYREKYLRTLLEGISIRNDILATHVGWMGEFIAVRNTGEIIGRLTNEEIMKIEEDAGDGSIIGWSKDKTKVWFYCNMDSYIVCFGVIDINKKMYMILERPPFFGSHEYTIDFDTGDIYYTDYRFQFDPESGKSTKKAGTVFHLYSYNFYSEELHEIDTNIGEGFIIKYDQNQGLSYEKSNYY